MSGIGGVYRYDHGRLSGDTIQRITDALSHRGHDGTWVYHDDHAGIGKQELHATPESSRGPRRIVSDGRTVAGDVRLDNREQLFSELDVDTRPASTTDEQLVLAAYENWGKQTPRHLLGAFAFLVWDRRQSRLFGARDHMGVKPFYYADTGRELVVGSEEGAVLSHHGVDPTVDERRIGEFLLGRFPDEERTFYSQVSRLPPAHWIAASPDGVEQRQYWSLDATTTLDLGSDEAYERRFRDLFSDAVRARLRGLGSTGAMLSGGLDSSSIVCTANELLGSTGRERLPTYSFVFDSVPESDESEYIEAVLAEGNYDATYIHGDELNPLSALDICGRSLAGPLHYPNAVLDRQAFREARDEGVGVILSGYLGDDIVSHGFEWLPHLFLRGRWRRLLEEVVNLDETFGETPREVVWQRVVLPLVPPIVRSVYSRLRGGRDRQIPEVVSGEFARRLELADRLRRSGDGGPRGYSPSRRHAEAIRRPLNTAGFEIQDRLSAPFGIEKRFPFADIRLVEFCVSLPRDQILREGRTKDIMRRALSEALPPKIENRRDKRYVGPNFNEQFKGGLSTVERLFDEFSPDSTRYVDVEAVRTAIEAYTGEDGDEDAGHLELFQLWNATALCYWIDASPRNDVFRPDHS